MSKKLVLVEDDPVIAETLSLTLSYRGFDVTVASDVAKAQTLFESHAFDIAVLDVALPDGDGYELCREMRATEPRMPILMLTARIDEPSAVRGIAAGADDYVRKPCGLDELVARLDRLLDRPNAKPLRFRSLRIDPAARQVTVGDRPVVLRRREYALISLLARHAGNVVTRDQILAEIDRDGELFDRAIDPHVSRLRTKLRRAGLKDARIVAIYGVGYRLEAA